MLWHGEENRSPGLAIWCWLYAGYPHFPWGESGLCSLFIEGRKRKERQTERERIPGLWMYYTAVTDGYVFPRGQSQSPSFGRMDFILRYFRRLFITVVSYCSARQRSVKRGPGFLQGEKTDRYREAIDIHISVNISDPSQLIKRNMDRPTEFTHIIYRQQFKDLSGPLRSRHCSILCFPGWTLCQSNY